MTCSAGNRFPLVEPQYTHRHRVVRLPGILLGVGKCETQSQLMLKATWVAFVQENLANSVLKKFTVTKTSTVV